MASPQDDRSPNGLLIPAGGSTPWSPKAAHLNNLAWAQNRCAHDPHAALETADAALTVARSCEDALQTGWALGYGAGALRRLGRMDEAIARLRASAACHHDNPTPRADSPS
ncbi:hypothetical protein [Streptomyces sp. NPDC014894]|uniref:hypothetical protein n=1 Tax=Streptomyces sp. NPDC014894 TaxID=3364931 RepID=UPI00370176DB